MEGFVGGVTLAGLYVAVIVTPADPAKLPTVLAVTATAHAKAVPDADRAHVAPYGKDTDAIPDWARVTVSPVMSPYAPDTVVVHDKEFPTVAVQAGLHNTEVEVAALASVISDDDPELCALLPSPPYVAVIVTPPLPGPVPK